MSPGPSRASFEDDDLDATSVDAPLLPLKPLRGGDDDNSNRVNSTSTAGRRRRRSLEGSDSTGASYFFGTFHNLFSRWTSGSIPRTGARKSVRRRAFQCCLLLISAPLLLLVCGVLGWGGLPRSYGDIRKLERQLPQHRWADVAVSSDGELVEASGGKRYNWEQEAGEGYLRFPNHLWGHGFNNILEEILLDAQLAHLSNRTYVFEDYVWSHSPLPYTLYDFALRPTRVPINAFISGFIAGGSVPSTSNQPAHNSISARYYENVCPSSLPDDHRVVLSVDDAPDFWDGKAHMEWWVEKIKTAGKGKRCVEIRENDVGRGSGKRLFGFGFFMSHPHVSPVVPPLLESPVLKHFSWSPLVNSAVQRTVDVLGLSSSTANDTTLPGLLAIHLRRGDYSRHCARLAGWKAGYMGFNLAEGVKDRLDAKEAWKDEKEAATQRERRREEGRALRRKEIEQGNSEDEALERRWWYWAGKAGQRLTSGEAGVTGHTSAPNPQTKQIVAKPPQTHDAPSATAEGTSGSSGKVKIQKDLDFRKAGGGFVVGTNTQQFVAMVETDSKTAEEGNTSAKATEPPRRWMWWGGGSKKGGKSVSRKARSKKPKGQSVEETATPRPQFPFSGLDLDSIEQLERRGMESELPNLERRDAKEDAIKHYYFKHCLPTIEQVVERAREVRDDWAKTASDHGHPHTPLTRILLLSNGWPSFLLELAAALRKEDWEVVDPDESIRKGMGKLNDVDVAVDMALAQRAEVFLGNGFSTLSGNVILLRMAAGEESEGNRLLRRGV